MSARLRKSEVRELDEELPITLSKKDVVVREGDALLINGRLSFIFLADSWVPALPLLLEREDLLPQVVVDMGAVKFVANGADIMRPGIVEVPDCEEGSFVVVVDERNRKPLGVGRAKFSGAEMRLMSSGNVVESLHFVGDEYWKKYSN